MYKHTHRPAPPHSSPPPGPSIVCLCAFISRNCTDVRIDRGRGGGWVVCVICCTQAGKYTHTMHYSPLHYFLSLSMSHAILNSLVFFSLSRRKFCVCVNILIALERRERKVYTHRVVVASRYHNTPNLEIQNTHTRTHLYFQILKCN